MNKSTMDNEELYLKFLDIFERSENKSMDLIKANLGLTKLVESVKQDSAIQISSYREELHSAKDRIENYETKISDLQKRCERLQEKYDALHEKYDKMTENMQRFAEKSFDSKAGSKAEVKISNI